MIELINDDYMNGLKECPDNHFDLALVDPPYFDGPDSDGYYGKEYSSTNIKRTEYLNLSNWDKPTIEEFEEIIRTSKNQIIFGVNYFGYYNFGPGRIIWDKVSSHPSFSDAEIAYCSLHDSTKIFSYMWSGFMQGKSIKDGRTMQGNKELKEKRIHPTQKPVALYKWLLDNYSAGNDLILDTHAGSFSSGIACHQMNRRCVGYEIDKEMHSLASKRFEEETMQLTLDF